MQGQTVGRAQFAVGGRLERLTVDRSSGSPTLDEAALRLVKEGERACFRYRMHCDPRTSRFRCP